MAHVAKYNRNAIGNLMAHYMRSRESTLDRSNIDRSRTRLNYDLRPTDMLGEIRSALAMHERTAGRRARSDAVVMFDWVVTLPGNVPEERSREFFESVASFVEGRYGERNVLGAFVHMDETTPHVHVSVLPMRDGKLQASKMVSRADLRTFHEALRAAVSADMGFDVEILLDESKRAEKELSRLSQREYIEAKREIAATSERLERVRRAEEDTHGTPWADAREAREEESLDRELAELERKERSLGEEVARLERDVAGLQGAVDEEQRRASDLGERVQELGAHIRELREALAPYFEALRERVSSLVASAARAISIPEPVKERPKVPQREPVEEKKPSRKSPAPSRSSRRTPGPPARTRPSPESDMRAAQAQARARSAGGASQGRGRGL